MGYRWQIPSGIKTSNSLIAKFTSLDTYASAIVLHKLKFLVIETSHTFNPLALSSYDYKYDLLGSHLQESWVPDENVRNYIQAYRNNEVREWKLVRNIFLRIFKVRRFLSGLIHRWRIAKCLKNVKNTEDPVTLEVPKKLVRVLDFPKRISYIYEATTLRKTIELRISQSDYMFPNPLDPINPFTNESFTRGQIMSIIKQCKQHGEFSWILDRLYASEADLKLFIIRFRQPLKILAIENHFKGSIYKYRDEVIDFFQVEADRGELPDDKVDKFIQRVDDRPECKFVREWVNITRDLYIAKELQDTTLLTKVFRKSTASIGEAYDILR